MSSTPPTHGSPIAVVAVLIANLAIAAAKFGAALLKSLRSMHLGPDHVVITTRVIFRPGRKDISAVIAALKRRLAEPDPLLRDVAIEPAADD